MTPKQFEKLVAKGNALAEKLTDMHVKLDEIDNLIFMHCKCPPEDRLQKSSYSHGGYDYQGEDRTWEECKICGRIHNEKIRYTGFG